ncbi:hypothetical protein POTOM_060403 [Populus tomentosa]|uniref:Uncharacterized protein n=1 Tax=Populus tomentosa TaxID=118781 RepID=A0A8X7XQW9_POPTO|nr:hypothetical protein POTOM_060403 [Populus tomentosa]
MIIGLLWVPDVHFNALTNEYGKSKGIAILMQRRVLDGKFKLCKGQSVQFGQKGIPYLNSYDIQARIVKAEDTIKLDLENNNTIVKEAGIYEFSLAYFASGASTVDELILKLLKVLLRIYEFSLAYFASGASTVDELALN